MSAAPMLRPRLGPRFGAIDAGAVARAEAALASLSGQFDAWMDAELEKLAAARAAVAAVGWNAETAEAVYVRAHDLKGLGTTYGFPLVTRVAASLCRLLDHGDRSVAPLTLVDAHAQAIRAIVRDSMKSDEHPVGEAVAAELESRVAATRAAESAED